MAEQQQQQQQVKDQKTFETPDYSHVFGSTVVYEPAEDTFLLLDGLQRDYGHLQRLFGDEGKGCICAEIGVGSGCVLTFIRNILHPMPIYALGSDVNEMALQSAMVTMQRNTAGVAVKCKYGVESFVRNDLLASVRGRLKGKVDLLIFNPPYVPTDEDPRDIGRNCDNNNSNNRGKEYVDDLASAWAGGENGVEVLNRLMPQLPALMTPGIGTFYLVALKENNIEDIMKRMEELGFVGKIVIERRAGREYLYILRFIYSHPTT